MRIALLLLVFAVPAIVVPAPAQQPKAPESPAPAGPIDIPALLHDVENQQKAAEQAQRNYLYKVTTVRDETDSKGTSKKISTTVSDSLTLRGVRVNRVVSRNGKPLSTDEQKKEIDRIDKEVDKANEHIREAQEKGKDVSPHGDDEVTVSRFLQLGSFSNARREMRDGRSTIAVDFTGDAKAKTKNRAEGLIRDLTGTVWVDEQDRSIYRIQGHAMQDFKVGLGMVADLKRDTNFDLRFAKINNEVWLPAQFDLQGSLHYLLFFSFTGSVHISFADYRKFQASATVLYVQKPDQPADAQPQTAAPTTPTP